MVQETQPVPDELYNLTQLAEVSLAAGRLNTHPYQPYRGDVGLENFPGHPKTYLKLGYESPQTYADFYIPSYVSTSSLSSCSDNESTTTDYKYSSTKKKWKSNWENNTTYNNGCKQQAMETHDESSNGSTHSTTTTKTTKTYANLGDNSIRSYIKVSHCQSDQSFEEDPQRRRSFTATSDESEDSTYSYAHKVFDRKKSRTFHAADNAADECGTKQSSDLEFDNRASGGDNDNVSTSGERSLYCAVGGLDVHICPECGKKYSTSSNLARHRQTHR
jgi:hypothetical protein